MIDLKELRADPEKFRRGAANKRLDVDINALLRCDQQLRDAMNRRQELTAEKNQIGKQIGQIAGRLKDASGQVKADLEAQITQLRARPSQLKQDEAVITQQVEQLQIQRDRLWLQVPMPADQDVPVGNSSDDNVEIKRWYPPWFDLSRSFQENKGFKPKTHIELMRNLGLVDFERGVKLAGTRSYLLAGDGMRLHQAVLRCGFDFMVNENNFSPMGVPTLVHDQLLVGTGFFPHGVDQVYHVANPTGEGSAQCLTGTSEVGLMGVHQGEILEFNQLPRTYVSLSTCYRREAGAAGRDTAGLYRIHQFEKVEQVVVCQADEQISRNWHQKMIGFVEALMQRFELPYRLLQCCTGDLGPKNADQVDIEAWIPGRGSDDETSRPTGAFGETHSASKVYDYQCRRLNLRYRDPETRKPVFCHALNNTVVASPRILIPIVELYQNRDGSLTIPEALRPYMNDQEQIG